MAGRVVDGAQEVVAGEAAPPVMRGLPTRSPPDCDAAMFAGIEATDPLRALLDGGGAPLDTGRDTSRPGHRRSTASGRQTRVPGVVVDALAMAAAAMAAAAAQGVHAHDAGLRGLPVAVHTLVRISFVVPVLVGVIATSRRPVGCRLQTTLGHHLRVVIVPLLAGAAASLMLWRVLEAPAHLPPAPLDAVLLTAVLGAVIVAVSRLAHDAPPRRHGRRARRVVIVGSGVVAERMRTQLTSRRVQVVGFVDDDPKDASNCLGPLFALSEVCAREQVDHVVVAFSRTCSERMIDVLRPLQGYLPITVVPRLFDVVPMTADVQELADGFPGLSVAPGRFGRGQGALKRTGDIVGASVALAMLLPVFLAVALAVRLTSAGPVILRQARVGRDGKVFPMLKFRTMAVTGSSDMPSRPEGEAVLGPFPKLKDDPRTTPVGRLLRRISIDELPQLINVLRGQMSLVGPRPFIIEDAQCMGGWALRRYSVRPGITGLWQVSGRNDLTYDEMCRLDDLYVTCWSPGLDIKVLVRTLRAVSARRGAY